MLEETTSRKSRLMTIKTDAQTTSILLPPKPLLVFCILLKTNGDCYWFVDVDGEITPFLTGGHKEEPLYVNRVNEATELLKEIARRLKQEGIYIFSVGSYTGNASPTHILRNGSIWEIHQTIPPEKIPAWMD